MHSDLIYDVGFHTGEDTDFYLRKGFRVVAVEADPQACERGAERFAEAIRSGQLRLVNKAVARERGSIQFYRNDADGGWSTCSPLFAGRWASMGGRTTAMKVQAVTMADLLKTYGTPYYLKIDIEGFDGVCIDGLTQAQELPRYVSWEAERDNFVQLKHELQTMVDLGYTEFKVVPQRALAGTVAPQPASEGEYAPFTFTKYSSGPFGEELPGRWVDHRGAIEAFKKAYVTNALVGQDPIFNRPWTSIAWRLGLRPDWHDCHARRPKES